METKSLSSRQVRWAQELSRYYFQIEYCQGKTNKATDVLSKYLQQSAKEEETLRTENVKILYHLQSSLSNASFSGLSASAELSSLHQVLICGTHVLPQLRQFWDTFQAKLGAEGPYQVSIGAMHLRLSELQESDDKVRKIRVEGLKSDYKEVDGVLHHQGLLFIPEAIWTKLISQHYKNPLAGYFGIDKTTELVGRKYYWLSLRKDVESYVWGCDVCLASKTVRQKPYGDLQSLPIPTHRWKDLFMDFVIKLPLFSDWKGNSYDSILVIVNRLTKIVHYEPVKVNIDALELAEVIIDMVVRHYGLPDSIVTNRGSVFTSKFWPSLCYFLGVK